MAVVLRFPDRRAHPSRAENLSHLIQALTCHRHPQEDVYWLKENAELLSVLECSGEFSAEKSQVGAHDLAKACPTALSPLRRFYKDADRHLCFFRQYYRFILSICLDLEDLGLVDTGGGDRAEALAHWVRQQDLPQHELSDLQRAEARRLLARRGLEGDFPGLDGRLRLFADNTTQFAVPNRKAAYELTHIVFYLSDYGRRDPDLSAQARLSLDHLGVLAFLDQDADLLSEVCIALRYCGETPAAAWEAWLRHHHQGFALSSAERATAPSLHCDDYHMFLVSSWYQGLSTGSCFNQEIPPGALRFQRPERTGILHQLSHAVFHAGGQVGDWHRLRSQVCAELSEPAYQILCQAEQSSADFGVFFEAFARRGTIQPTVTQAEVG
ncbi:hypothetical protein MED193_22391 [Roseobacter sp. MED193]|uniref:DUF6902 family protein n=1 Tax=Roseobacter sp. MED193 TaxID=314262 RepID=UPI000068BB93|nr:hypothetical protein [Roseobacter sp. MED193]EAQ44906.1 hypothetical protein MED193_22391 [Roseobacter sp. MED193]